MNILTGYSMFLKEEVWQKPVIPWEFKGIPGFPESQTWRRSSRFYEKIQYITF